MADRAGFPACYWYIVAVGLRATVGRIRQTPGHGGAIRSYGVLRRTFSGILGWWSAALYAWLLTRALRWAHWRRLADADQLNVFLGAAVCVLLLWTLRTEIQPGFHWHLSTMVTLTLMFGWSLAVVAGSLALLGATLFGLNDWSGLAPTALVFIMLPAALTQVLLGLARAYLPKHYFVYVFVNAFFAGGLVTVLVALTASGLLLAAGAFPLQRLIDNYLLFLP
ncbi:MAG: energy-coupling factor ABC transporter permease [Chromatiaceae bacterium]|nr:energy-coupling factor ABC transporter permease [Chromatiaceae bacterium]